MKELTFEELALELASARFWNNGDEFVKTAANILQQVREATIAEAANYCVSQDWVKTIDNLKRMPTDRIIDFENLPTDISANEKVFLKNGLRKLK